MAKKFEKSDSRKQLKKELVKKFMEVMSDDFSYLPKSKQKSLAQGVVNVADKKTSGRSDAALKRYFNQQVNNVKSMVHGARQAALMMRSMTASRSQNSSPEKPITLQYRNLPSSGPTGF